MADTQDYSNLIPPNSPQSTDIVLDPEEIKKQQQPQQAPANDAIASKFMANGPGVGSAVDSMIDQVGGKVAGDAYPAIKEQVQQGVPTPEAIDNVATGAKELADQAETTADQHKEALQEIHTQAVDAKDKYSEIYNHAKNAATAYQAASDAVQAQNADKQAKDEEAIQKAQDEIQKSKEEGAKSLYDIMHSSSLGSKIGAGIAVIMGGLGQGLMRSNTNQVLDSIDKAAVQEGEKRKLTQNQLDNLRQATRQRALDGLQMKEKTLTNQDQIAKLQDTISQARLRDQQSELTKVKAIAAGAKVGRGAEQLGGSPLSLQEVAALTEPEKKGLMQIKGQWYRSAKPDRVAEFADMYERYENSRPALQKMRDLLENGQFESFVKKGLTGGVEDKRKFEQAKEMIMETIKQPYTGKGIFREGQRAHLEKILAKRDLTSLTPVEKDVLKDFVVDFDARVQNSAKKAGFGNIDVLNHNYVPVTQNGKTSYIEHDKFIDGLMKNPKFKDVPRAQLESIVDKKIKNSQQPSED